MDGCGDCHSLSHISGHFISDTVIKNNEKIVRCLYNPLNVINKTGLLV